MQEIIIVCTPLRFYAQNDEHNFFEWLKKLSCINDIKGIGRELHLYVSSNDIPFDELQDLYSIFKRYKLENIEQLQIFKNEKNKEWFED